MTVTRVTKDNLINYRNMKKLLEELNRQLEDARNTYHSPSFELRGGSGQRSTTSPQEKALAKIQRIEDRMSEVMDDMETIESYVDSIEDYDVRAILLCHFIRDQSWKATSYCLHESESSIRDKARKYFIEHDMM